MTVPQYRIIGGLLSTLLAGSLGGTAQTAAKDFRLARAVPNDVFLLVNGRHNPEAAFIDAYWAEVFDAFCKSGILEDTIGLAVSLAGDEHLAEVQRVKERFTELLRQVDWGRLLSGEMAFTERMSEPMHLGSKIVMGPPDMVVLFQLPDANVTKEYESLVAILTALAEEVNRAADSEVLAVERTAQFGGEIASCNLLRAKPEAAPVPVSVARRGDVIAVAFGQGILHDALALLDGSSPKQALADDPRFKDAFGRLPPAEEVQVFFDMRRMVASLSRLADLATSELREQHDVIVNTARSEKAGELNSQAMAAYHRSNMNDALSLVRQAHAEDPGDSLILYNLACFSALAGKPDEALDALEKAVEAGFYAPRKISDDSDLASLRENPRFSAALDRAAALAARNGAEDKIINSSKTGEAYKLRTQAMSHYAQQDFEQGLRLLQQALEIAPGDSSTLYDIACFHARLGHRDQALEYLEQAVRAGFYCPRHIAQDEDLESLRGDVRYAAAHAEARARSAELAARQVEDNITAVQRVAERVINALTVMEYSATVQWTEGYATHSESISIMAADAAERPIYSVLQPGVNLTDYERFLPKETQSFAAWSGFDMQAGYTFLLDTIRAAGPAGEGVLAKWDELQETIGLDVEQDVLSWMDGESMQVTLEDGGWVYFLKVREAQQARSAIQQAIEFLSAKLAEFIPKQPMLGMLAVHTSPVNSDDLPGFQNVHLALAPQQPVVWGVAEDRVIFGQPAEAVALCLRTARGRHPNLRENPRIMKEALLPNVPSSYVALSDQRKMGEDLASMAGAVSMGSGMMIMAIPDPEAKKVLTKVSGIVAKLPPVLRKIDFYKSTATQISMDGQDYRTRMVTHYFRPDERPSAAGANPPASAEPGSE